MVNQVVNERDKNKIRRDDLIQVIIDLRDKHGKVEFDEDTIVGHAMTLWVSMPPPYLLNLIHFFRRKATRHPAQQCQ